jgi:hypothetical protein
MLFAKIALAATVVFALSSGIAGIPSVRSDTVAGSPSSARLIAPPQTFYSPNFSSFHHISGADMFELCPHRWAGIRQVGQWFQR